MKSSRVLNKASAKISSLVRGNQSDFFFRRKKIPISQLCQLRYVDS